MTTTEPHPVEEAANKLLDEAAANDGQQSTEGKTAPLDGMAADCKVSVLGMNFSTEQKFEVGDRVELKVIGTVKMEGRELLEKEGLRRCAKIDADLIQIVHPEDGDDE